MHGDTKPLTAFYEDAFVRVFNENCVDTLGNMADDTLDLTVTSPPYDDLRVYNGYDFPFEQIARLLFQKTKPGGVVVWVVNDKTVKGSETGTSFRQALFFKEVGFKLWDTEIYEKANPFPGDCGLRYQQTWEFMFVFVKGKEPNTFNPIQMPSKNPGKVMSRDRLEASGRRNIEKGWYGASERGVAVVSENRVAGNIFTYVVGIGTGTDHPAVFPLQLAADHITSWSNEGDTVYDCFLGSGTTAIAAKRLGRKCIGSEISAEYCELIASRIKAETALPLLDALTDEIAA